MTSSAEEGNDKIFGMAIERIKCLVYSLTYRKQSENPLCFLFPAVKFKNPHAPGRCLAWFVDQRIEFLIVLLLSMRKALGWQNSEKVGGGGEEGKRIKRSEKIHISDASQLV